MKQSTINHISPSSGKMMPSDTAATTSKNITKWVPVIIASVCLLPALSSAADKPETLSYLKTLSIEELLETKITSVSKKPEQLFDAAAAITVLSAEDIRRTGARTIPDILRLVPGLQVARIDGSRWEVGARGFSDFFENKLLVLVDGRSMYTPLYSGVYWNSLDTILEDIERIEVIRGPGATIWGANAVNGVINIITKHSSDTQGGLLTTTYGSHEKPSVSTRYGGHLGAETDYRLYAKAVEREPFENDAGDDANDAFDSVRAGFRLDSNLSNSNRWSLQAEAYSGEADFTSRLSGYLTPPLTRLENGTEDFRGGHVMADYQHSFSPESVVDIKFYYDHYSHELGIAEEKRDTLDFEFQHHYSHITNHDIVWGGGIRWSEDETIGTFFTSFSPASRSTALWSAFIQDDITLVDERFWLTIGSKFEHNDYSGFEVQPSLRLRLRPRDNHLIWGAVSRAVRTPSRSEHDITINFASFTREDMFFLQRLQGNDSFDSEMLLAYELGYRWQASESLSFDLATFYNDYDQLRSLEGGRPYFETTPPPPHLVLPQYFGNEVEGESYGIEFTTTWQPLENLKIITGYAWMNLHLFSSDPLEPMMISPDDNYPRHQFHVRSYYDLTPHIQLDGELYWVDDYKAEDIDDYVRLDLQASWVPCSSFRLSLSGENLLHSAQTEAIVAGAGIVPSRIPAQYWLKAQFSF